MAYNSNDIQILVKTLGDGEKAVAIFNRGSGAMESTCRPRSSSTGRCARRAHRSVDEEAAQLHRGNEAARRAARDDDLPREGHARLAEGLYLSEQPGSVNPAVDGVTRPNAEPTIFRTGRLGRTHGAGERPQ